MNSFRFGSFLTMISLVIAASGCFFVQGFVQTAITDAGRAQCAGTACELDKWIVFGTEQFQVYSAYTSDHRLPCVTLQNAIVTASINPPRDLLLAYVTRDGALHVCEYSGANGQHLRGVNAVGVAWSNAGDRLAVVTRDAEGDAAYLEIRDPELNLLDTFAIELPSADAPTEAGRAIEVTRRVLVSWSADDKLVSASTNYRRLASFVDVASGELRTETLLTVLFIGDRRIVAEAPVLVGAEVVALELQTDGLKQLASYPGAIEPLASDPLAGVFLTGQQRTYFERRLVEGIDAGLRTIDAGPNYLGYTIFRRDTLMLAPRDVALPVIQSYVMPDEAELACPE